MGVHYIIFSRKQNKGKVAKESEKKSHRVGEGIFQPVELPECNEIKKCIRKMGKRFKQSFHKRGHQNINNHMKRYSISLKLRKIKSKL